MSSSQLDDTDLPRKKRVIPQKQATPTPTPAEILQRRKQGRIKAAATIALNLKKTGIGRVDTQNGFPLTSVASVPLINQKNYFTEYLRKDDQIRFIRNWRSQKLQQQLLKQSSPVPKDSLKKEDPPKDPAPKDEDEDEDEDDEDDDDSKPEKARIGHDTIVIHPGSAYTRIGRATDAVPVTIPTVIAVRTDPPAPSNPDPVPTRNTDSPSFFGQKFDHYKLIVTKDFKTRMRYYKRRILPNSRESAANYNRKQLPEQIADHNDPYKKEWLNYTEQPWCDAKFLVGDDALKLPLDPTRPCPFTLRYPLVLGGFNQHCPDYASPQQLYGDIANILRESLRKMEVSDNLSNLKALLVIPDLYDKTYVETLVYILFTFVGFGRVGIIQEAVAATFGAGATCACVIDVGAHKTSVSCVDEGMVISDSRVRLNYGGDHITETLLKLLIENSFPFSDIDLSRRNDDWELAQNLKHSFVTCQDADIAVQVYSFYKRRPNEPTQKYEFKCFDEVMLAPLGLFYPELFDDGRPLIPLLAFDPVPNRALFPVPTDQYSLSPNNPISRAQENLVAGTPHADTDERALIGRLCDYKINKTVNATPAGNITMNTAVPESDMRSARHTPLEKAIIESITWAGLATDLSKMPKLYDNLLVVGGGFAKVAGFDLVLTDRINIWRPKVLSSMAVELVISLVQDKYKELEADREQALLEFRQQKAADMGIAAENVQLLPREIAEATRDIVVDVDLEQVDALCDGAASMPVNVLPPPREFDPAMLAWKGGCVYGRLKVANEMWITMDDWDMLQSRCLYYKSLFNY